MMRDPFDAIVATCAKVATQPLAKQRAALAKLNVSPADKPGMLVDFAMRLFFQKKNGEPTDRLAWVFVNAAIDRRDVLPWDRGSMTHIVRASTPRPETFPPWILANAVEQFAATFGKPLPKELCGWIAKTADVLEKHANDADTRDAVSRLRASSAAKTTPVAHAKTTLAAHAKTTPVARNAATRRVRASARSARVVSRGRRRSARAR